MQDYTDQIRAAEKQRDANPELAPLHLLLGYHFGYLGYPKQAVGELEKAVELAPRDQIAQRLARGLFRSPEHGSQTGRNHFRAGGSGAPTRKGLLAVC